LPFQLHQPLVGRFVGRLDGAQVSGQQGQRCAPAWPRGGIARPRCLNHIERRCPTGHVGKLGVAMSATARRDRFMLEFEWTLLKAKPQPASG
jgi:hypothetical protein